MRKTTLILLELLNEIKSGTKANGTALHMKTIVVRKDRIRRMNID